MIFGVYLLIRKRALRLHSGLSCRPRAVHPALREYRVGIVPNFKQKSTKKRPKIAKILAALPAPHEIGVCRLPTHFSGGRNLVHCHSERSEESQ
jgi:hypothetical protein